MVTFSKCAAIRGLAPNSRRRHDLGGTSPNAKRPIAIFIGKDSEFQEFQDEITPNSAGGADCKDSNAVDSVA